MESIKFIGEVKSPLTEIGECPLQENEGAPPVVLHIYDEFHPALSGLSAGSGILLFTWLHKAKRDTLTTKPRNDPKAPLTGIFATRSPDRPNPIGLHKTKILEVNDGYISVSNLEVLNGTPIVDIKPVL